MEKLLTIKQLSELLQVSPKTIYQWTHIGFIPHYKLPKGVRFNESDINKWIQHKRIKGRVSYNTNIADQLSI